ncbi:MAG: hypothetical protein F6K00_30025 [Leptolyngbya sp. SIOISBB]|nr:hypothetical protein [Leptolyngbya sp. SIOISBB]
MNFSPLAQVTETPLTQGAAEIFEAAQQTAEAVAANFDGLWESVLNGGLYQASVAIGILLAVLSLALFLVQWGGQMLFGEGDKALAELIWPLIVIVCLTNNGERLSTVIVELRDIGNQINTSILDSAVEGESVAASYQRERARDALGANLAARIAECVENGPQRQQSACIQQARREDAEARQRLALPFDEQDTWLGGVVQFVIRNLLWALHSAFQWAVEIVLLILALLAPLAMGLSLLPVPSKPIISWVSGFAGMFLIKINFNLISGLAAYAVSLSGYSANSLLLPLLLGVIAPVLAVMVGLSGGTALFNAISTAVVFVAIRSSAGLSSGAIKYGPRAIKSSYQLARRNLRRS